MSASSIHRLNWQSTLLAILAFLILPSAPAAPGDVDSLNVTVGGTYVLATAVQPDGKIIIAGSFSSVLGQPRNNIARLNADGTLDLGFNPDASGLVLSVVVQADDQILLGGEFTSVGGTPRNYVARVAANGMLDAGFNPNASSTVLSVAVQADGQILLGGFFTNVGGTPRSRIARVAANGILDGGFNPNADGTVYSVAVQADGQILLGGDFSNVGGTPRTRMARVAANGALDPGFYPSPNGTVYSVAVQADGQILLGGSFFSVGGPTRNNIARVAANGTLDVGFNPNANGAVDSVAVQADGKILLGGGFISVGGTTRNRIARVAANGTLDTGFNPNASNYVHSVAVQADGKILLGGQFTTVGVSGRALFARLLNDPATQTLSVPSASQVTWTRGGSAPDVSQVTFELSTNGGSSYTPLGGTATRVGSTANWQLTGLSLPANGQLRARGRTTGGRLNASSGLVEQVASFGSPLAPTATTIAATSFTATGATLNGTINANGLSTAVSFDYGTSISYGTNVAGTPTPVTGSTASNVSATVTGLSPGTIYHFSVKGVSSAGISTVSDMTFTTLGVPNMAVKGNGNTISPGDASPTLSDNTDFGSHSTASSTLPLDFTIANTGDAVLTLSGSPRVVIGGTHFSDFTVTTLPATSVAITTGVTTFSIRFQPGGDGLRQATVSIPNNDPNKNPYTFAIQGTGLGTPDIEVSGSGNVIGNGDTTPTTADLTDFGLWSVPGPVVKSQVFAIRNRGDKALTFSNVTISGLQASEFTVFPQPTSPVAPGDVRSFTINFDPNAAGLRKATVNISSNDPDESPFTFDIQGTGTGVGIATMAVKGNGNTIASGDTSPSTDDFTTFVSVALGGAPPATRNFTITNTGDADLNLFDIPKVAISGTEFTVTTQPISPVIPGGTANFTVSFLPNAVGLRTATVSIANNDAGKNPYIFAIEGTGTASSGIGGTVWAWGNNQAGQTTRTATTSSPYNAIAKPVLNLNGVTMIAAGESHTVALKSDGTVEVWGDNTYGQRNVPAGLSGVKAIAAGDYHTVALKNDGTLWAWGRNQYGQVTGTATTSSPYFAAANPVTLQGQVLKGVTAIAAGASHTVALKNDGTVVAWGYNGYGLTTPPPDLSGVRAIAAGGNHSAALMSDGKVIPWGDPQYGMQAESKSLNGVTAIAMGGNHLAALRSNGTVVVLGDFSFGQKMVPAGLTGVTAIAAGQKHIVALKGDGRLATWGFNDIGQVSGTPLTGYEAANPVTLQSEILNSVTAIAAGGAHTLAMIGDTAPVLTMHRADPVSALPDGVTEPFPLIDIDLPLIPTTATSILKDSCTTPISGLVCDGVTPLLFKLKNRWTTSATDYEISISVANLDAVPPYVGGSVTGGLANHLHVLSNGQWAPITDTATGPVRLTVPAPASGQTFSESYGYISAIPAESLMPDPGSKEVVCLLSVQQKVGTVSVGPPIITTLYLRKPPIALVHGYRTPGEWGAAFKDTLMPGGATDPFIVQLQYGVKPDTFYGSDTTDNTVLSLATLSPMLSEQFKRRLDDVSAPLRSNWAYTRYDVVGHSQGGVLSRMLCSIKKDSPGVPAFRSVSNNFRGRFRRIITIGSPHNGSRYMHYLLKYAENGGVVSTFLKMGEVLQGKFDPWGPQIKDLNEPGGKWVPDASAKFLMVRSTINDGEAPGLFNLIPAYQLVDLRGQRGAVVLPHGSDGAVDLDAQGFFVADGNVHTMPIASNISHAEDEYLFLTTENQVKSTQIAAIVRDALSNQTLFKSFVMPPLLLDSVKSDIDAVTPFPQNPHNTVLRIASSPSGIAERSIATKGLQPPFALAFQTTHTFKLTPPTGQEAQGEVAWNVEVFGPNGVTLDGVTLMVNPTDSREVTVLVDAAVVGDVMLYAHYATVDGGIAFSDPIKVISVAPSGVTLSSLSLRPTSVSLPAGISLPLELWAGYSDGSNRQVYTSGGDVAFISLNTTVADVTASGTATLKTAGTAIVQATYQGITVVGQITVSSGSVPVVPVVADLTGAEGQSFQYQFTASNAPTYFGASGLPPGLTMNDKTGLLSGTPTASGVFTLSIAAANPAGVSLSRAVQLTVSPAPAAAPVIVVEQPAGVAQEDGTANIAFGSIHLGSNNTKVFTIRNNGVDDMTGLAVTKTGTHSGDFVINTTGMSATLPPGGNTTFNVTFAPTASGARTAALQIVSNLSGTLNPFDLALSGSGLVVNTSVRDVDTGFNPTIEGNYVLVTVVQPDGKVIIGGDFTSVNGSPRSYLARLNADGSLDLGFNPRVERLYQNGSVWSVALQKDGKILIGGAFTSLQPNGATNATTRNNIARVNSDGSLDMDFNPNADNFVRSVVLQANGKILTAGDFTTLQPNEAVSPTQRNRVARLNADGSLDMGFDPNPNDLVRSVVEQSDGKILIAGDFGTLRPNGALNTTSRYHIARVNADGSLDMGFDPKAVDGRINSVAVQADGKILLGGEFFTLQPNNAASSTPRRRIARVNTDGSIDMGFDPNLNNLVRSLCVQSDGKILIGGYFTTLQPSGAASATTRNYVARVNADGSVDTSFDPKPNNVIMSMAAQADGKVLLGGLMTSLQPNGAATATARTLFARMNNDVVTQSLTAPNVTQVQWQRGGASPELSQVTFELSSNGGSSWTPLGNGVRVGVTANWQITGLSLPTSGQLRASGYSVGGYGNGGSGLVQQVASYTASSIFSIDASLTNLQPSAGTLAPDFSATTTNYAFSVSNTTTAITVTPTKADANAAIQVRVNGGSYATVLSGSASANLSLNLGDNTIDTLVTAQDGTTTKNYTLTVRRQSNDATLAALSFSGLTLSPVFAAGTTSYTASVPFSMANTLVSATATHGSAVLTSGTGVRALAVGANTLDIVVTAEDGTTQTYSVAVFRNPKPVVVTSPATIVTSLSATLNGTVNAGGVSTNVTFEYGTSIAYDQMVSGVPATLSGTSAAAVSATLTNLIPGTLYHFRVKGMNAGDSGFGDDATFPTLANAAPTITNITDKSTNEDVTLSGIAFTVNDVETAPGSLNVTATSSNPTLVPNSDTYLIRGGSSGSRTLSIKPADQQSGITTITVTVTDGHGASASDTFVLTVVSVNDLPTITSVSNQTISEDGSTTALAFSLSDVETAPSSLVMTATSNTPAVVPNNPANLILGGSGANQTLTVIPAHDANGTSTITVQVADTDGGIRTTSFLLTVSAVNDAPTITSIGEQAILPNTTTGALPFTILDAETSAASLTLGKNSSNLALVPLNNIVFGGIGNNRTVTVTPATGQTGQATITVSVSDGTATTPISFLLRVSNNNTNLASLVLSSGSLSPSFASATTTYTATIGNTVPSITVTPTVVDANATVRVNGNLVTSGSASGAITLSVGSNPVITILVTAQDSSTKTYSITPTKNPLPVATTLDATAIGSSTSTLNGTVNPQGASTTVTFRYGTTTAYGSTANVIGSPFTGSSATSVNAALTGLLPGTLYHYQVLAANSTDSTPGADMNFTTVSDNARLASLALSAGSITFQPDTLIYSITVPNSPANLTLTPTVQQANATLKINTVSAPSGTGTSVPLTLGDNAIVLLVTAQDGITTRTYTLNVRRRSTDATLASLSLSGITLSPAFAAGTTSYTATVPFLTTSTTLAATTTHSSAVVTSGTGLRNLVVGANALSVLVTAEDQNTQTYTVTVTRAPASTNASLATLTLSVGTLVPAFASGTLTYSAIVAASVTSVTVTPTVQQANATLTIKGTTGASGIGRVVPLVTGDNVIPIVVTAQDGTTALAYSITIRQRSVVADLASLSLSGVTLSPVFTSATTAYTATVPNATTSTTITAAASHASATIAGDGLRSLNIGSNPLTVTVTAEDGNTKDYIVTVLRNPLPVAVTSAATNRAALSATLNGSINAGGVSTTVAFEYGTSTTYGQTVAGIPVSVSSSSAAPVSAALTNLIPGTLYHFRVKGTNSTDSIPGDDLTFTTLRNNANLSDLSLSTGTIAFSAATTSYTVTVSNATTSLTLTPTVSDAAASVKVGTIDVNSGSASAAQSLTVGNNAILVEVTAQDSAFKRTYTVNVIRNSLPTVTTGSATGITATAATLSGTVNASSLSTSVVIHYGITTAYGQTIVASPATVTGSSTTAVSATLSGLLSETLYHFKVVGMTATDTAPGADQTFTTLSDNAKLASLVLSAGTLSPAFQSTVFDYASTVPFSATSMTVTPTVQQPNSSVKVNTATAISGSPSGAISLSVGTNTVTVLVTAQNGGTQPYIVIVTRDPAPLPVTQAATLITATTATLNGAVTANGTTTGVSFDYGTSTSYGTTVTATPSSAMGYSPTLVSASLTGLTPNTVYHARVNGGIVPGANITFRTQDNNANLSGLVLNSGPLTPAFALTTLAYSSLVTSAITSVKLKPALASATATVKVNGVTVASGTYGADVPLVLGDNIIPVVVTAENGTVKTYNVTVRRQMLDVVYQDTRILKGDTTPSTPEGTDFAAPMLGSSLVRTFTIANASNTTLTITGIASAASQFVVSNIPVSVPANGTAEFTVSFTPSSYEQINTTLAITSNAPGDESYTFALRGGEGVAGALDFSFGNQGKVIFSDMPMAPNGMAIQDDGRILVAGSSGPDFGMLRYLPSGELDPEFGTGGKVVRDFGSNYDQGTGICIDSCGRIVVAIDNGYALSVARFMPNGSLDQSFGVGGVATVLGQSRSLHTASVAIQPDDKVVILGHGYITGTRSDFVVARLNVSGGLDQTFSQDGYVSVTFGDDVEGSKMIVDSKRRIVCVGRGFNASNFYMAIFRLSTDGSFDKTFDADGKVTFATNVSSGSKTSGRAFDVTEDANSGEIIAAGDAAAYSFSSMSLLARFSETGAPVGRGFIENSLQNDFGFGAVATSVALQSDRKLITATSNWGTDSVIARRRSDLSRDSSFAQSSFSRTDFGNDDDSSLVAIQRDGRIVVAGTTTNLTTSNLTLSRFWAGDRPAEIDVTHRGFTVRSGDITAAADKGTHFGTQNAGTSTLHTFQLANIGRSPLTLSRLHLDSSQFRLAGTPRMLEGGDALEFDLFFEPTATGKHDATVWISSDDADEGEYRFAVQGICGTPAGFAIIPDGTFQMGSVSPLLSPLIENSGLPLHSSTVSAVYVAQTEVTKAEWSEVYSWALAHGYHFFITGTGKAADHPVQMVSWYDAVKWCNARSEKEGLSPCYYTSAVMTEVYRTDHLDVPNDAVDWRADGYRLPTEAEWEKAARGGVAGRIFPWGDKIGHAQANYLNGSYITESPIGKSYHPTYKVGSYPYTSPVGKFPANGYGLKDMSGNVAEWCWDWLGGYPSTAVTDPLGPSTGTERMKRGGSFANSALDQEVSSRRPWEPSRISADVGFRCVRRAVTQSDVLADGKEINGRQGVGLSLDGFGITDRTARSVEYFVDGTKVGDGSGMNLIYKWLPTVGGAHTLQAVARNSAGVVVADVSITVTTTHVGGYAGGVLGTYVGLVASSPAVPATSGYVTLTSTAAGAFTVSLRMAGVTYSGKGVFDSAGKAQLVIPRKAPLASLAVQLTHSSTISLSQIVGRVTDGRFLTSSAVTGATFVTDFIADRLLWNATTAPCPHAGSYTMLIDPLTDLAFRPDVPHGYGYSTVTATAAGAVSFVGKLADGSAFTHSTSVSKDGVMPFYVPLYVNLGMAVAQLTLRDGGMSFTDGDGPMSWIRPPDPKAISFATGFSASVRAKLSRYRAPVLNARALNLTNLGSNGVIDFMDDSLSDRFARYFTLSSTNVAAFPLQGADKPVMTLTSSTGVFNGTFIHPRLQVSVPFQGVVFSRWEQAHGFFVAGTFGGTVGWSANPNWPVPATLGPIGVAPLPTLTISTPTSEATLPLLTSNVLVTGKAADAQGIQQVWYHVLHNGIVSDPILATGTTAWSFSVPIGSNEGGRYTVFVKALDSLGNQSNVASLGFWVKQLKPLAVSVIGAGTVTTGFSGTTDREVGKNYAITATPKAGKAFLGWSIIKPGAVSASPAKTISVMMEVGLQLEANFSP